MSDLQNLIMSDNSRLFAYLDDCTKSGKETNKIQDAIGIKLSNSRKTTNWYSFKYKNQGFSMLQDTDDIIFFAEDQDCPDRILMDLLTHFTKS